MRYKLGSSEMRSAMRMHEILKGHHPLTQDTYTVQEIADRYDLHRDTAYKAIRAGDPMLPRAEPLREGIRPRLVIGRAAVAACDWDRVTFYRTTPSWHTKFVVGAPPAPPRRSARAVLNGAIRSPKSHR